MGLEGPKIAHQPLPYSEMPYTFDYGTGEIPTQNLLATPVKSFYPWQRVSNTPDTLGLGPTSQDLPSGIPNEPEDFASFNKWYLNPVYADAEWQGAVERWRRRAGGGGRLSDEIWHFVKTKCCVKGCNFPDDFIELDKRINICGV